MIIITDELGEFKAIELDDFLPLSKKEFVYKNTYNDLYIPLYGKGIRTRLSKDSVILIKKFPIKNDITPKCAFTTSHKTKIQYLQIEKKIPFIYDKNGDFCELETNLLIVDTVNYLIAQSKILSRKIKAKKLEFEITNIISELKDKIPKDYQIVHSNEPKDEL